MSSGGYDFYLDKCLLPVAPAKLQISENGLNKVVRLIDGGEINLLKSAALKEIGFEFMIPQVSYPFSVQKGAVKPAEYYLGYMEGLKNARRPFQFIVSRTTPGGRILFSTDIKVSLESLSVTEAAEQGFDLLFGVRLRQYRDYGLKTISTASGGGVSKKTERGESTTAEKPAMIGAEVIINGRLYGNSYGEAAGQTRTNYRGKINYINLNGSHAYHVTTPSGQWLGWVTKESIRVI